MKDNPLQRTPTINLGNLVKHKPVGHICYQLDVNFRLQIKIKLLLKVTGKRGTYLTNKSINKNDGILEELEIFTTYPSFILIAFSNQTVLSFTFLV